MNVAAAYARCLSDARTHYENFPVASVLISAQMRPHVAAVYAFARAADDFADEGDWSPDERLRLLSRWRERLAQASAGLGPGEAPGPGEPAHAQAIFVALGASIRTLGLPVALFEDLLSAFAQDVRVTRYDTWDSLLDYCRRSANPVGRLVLRIGGYANPRLDEMSDAVCTALQLTNFWQDMKQDLARGRMYLPRDVQAASGADRSDLTHGLTEAWRRAIQDVVERTRQLFDAGRPLSGALSGRLKYEVRATWLGGTRVLDLIEHQQFDVLAHRPALGMTDVGRILVRLIR